MPSFSPYALNLTAVPLPLHFFVDTNAGENCSSIAYKRIESTWILVDHTSGLTFNVVVNYTKMRKRFGFIHSQSSVRLVRSRNQYQSVTANSSTCYKKFTINENNTSIDICNSGSQLSYLLDIFTHSSIASKTLYQDRIAQSLSCLESNQFYFKTNNCPANCTKSNSTYPISQSNGECLSAIFTMYCKYGWDDDNGKSMAAIFHVIHAMRKMIHSTHKNRIYGLVGLIGAMEVVMVIIDMYEKAIDVSLFGSSPVTVYLNTSRQQSKRLYFH
ncbi:hypothetical protein RFI_28941 [Reticulomyxa filosa]|uniref:Uncharacterized protein n=1 Tax=Reticulomyxa filosa TaxID=46433 RepID=X6M3E3_RETFI|nr:hypothetical protein RFI_28941 [Reticulomyxa filosa]|eukprot:ETO08444.1 hypothetical protein RFI_28941 [Reticulomyxa filosa]